MAEEPFGYDTDGDGYIDTEDSGSFFGYDFDGDGDIDADDDFYGFMMAEEGDFCFIATTVYGDLNHPQVVTLRRFWDRVLCRSGPVRALIHWYYRKGESVAELVSQREFLVRLFRSFLDRLVWLIPRVFF